MFCANKVITCCDDSSITFWNLLKGSKFLKVANAHDKEEISACCLDNAEKTLYTAARDGSIKVIKQSINKSRKEKTLKKYKLIRRGMLRMPK